MPFHSTNPVKSGDTTGRARSPSTQPAGGQLLRVSKLGQPMTPVYPLPGRRVIDPRLRRTPKLPPQPQQHTPKHTSRHRRPTRPRSQPRTIRLPQLRATRSQRPLRTNPHPHSPLIPRISRTPIHGRHIPRPIVPRPTPPPETLQLPGQLRLRQHRHRRMEPLTPRTEKQLQIRGLPTRSRRMPHIDQVPQPLPDQIRRSRSIHRVHLPIPHEPRRGIHAPAQPRLPRPPQLQERRGQPPLRQHLPRPMAGPQMPPTVRRQKRLRPHIIGQLQASVGHPRGDQFHIPHGPGQDGVRADRRPAVHALHQGSFHADRVHGHTGTSGRS